jgi:hypothetical protein
MNTFYAPHPVEMAVTLLDVCGNDLQKALELAKLAVDPCIKDDAEFQFRCEVVEALIPKEIGNA